MSKLFRPISFVRTAFLGACLLIVSIMPALALDPTAVAVVDLNRVIRDSDVGKDIARQGKEQGDALQAEVARKSVELQNEGKKIEEQKVVLGQDAYVQRMKDLQTRAQQAERDLGLKEAAMREGFNRAEKTLFDAMRPIIEEQMKAVGATMVINQSAIVAMGNPSALITSQVIAGLNAKIKTMKVTPVQPAPAPAAGAAR